MPIFEFCLRLGAAMLLGALIGLERQWRQRVTGLRTNTLVAVGACLFVELGSMLPAAASEGQIIAYVISGIGFLAGGVILKEGSNIRGLNTAATVWGTAAIGATVGAGFLLQGALGAVAILAANLILRPIANRIRRRGVEETETEPEPVYYHVDILCRSEDEAMLRNLLLQNVSALPLSLYSLRSEDTVHSGRILIDADLKSASRNDAALESLVGRLSIEPGVSALSWRVLADPHHIDLASIVTRRGETDQEDI